MESRGSGGRSGGGVEGAPQVPLHVSDAAHRLDLGQLGAKLGTLLVLALLKQVLEAPVAGVLVAHPAEGRRTTR